MTKDLLKVLDSTSIQDEESCSIHKGNYGLAYSIGFFVLNVSLIGESFR